MIIKQNIDKINKYHDSEIIGLDYKKSVLNILLGYIPNNSIYFENNEIIFSKVSYLTVLQSPNFGKNYCDCIEKWQRKKIKYLNQLISKGTLEFLYIEKKSNDYLIKLFWSSDYQKKHYKRKYILLLFTCAN